MIRISLMLGLWLLCLQINAQSYSVLTEKLSTQDGLSNRFVYSMMQDSRGYMWFGTKGGLNRYDGSRFKVFEVGETNLQTNPIKSLCEDTDEKLWIFHSSRKDAYMKQNNIDVLDLNTHEIQSAERYLGKKLPFSTENVVQVHCDQASKYIYYMMDQGAVWIYEGQKKWRLFYQRPDKKKLLNSIIGEKYIWIICKGEAFALDRSGKVVHKVALPILPVVDDAPDYDYLVLGERDANSVWLQLQSRDIGPNFLWEPQENQLTPFQALHEGLSPVGHMSKIYYCKKSQLYIHYHQRVVRLYDKDFILLHE